MSDENNQFNNDSITIFSLNSKKVLFFSFGKYISPPLGIGYLISYAKKCGLDFNFQYLENLNNIEEAAEQINKLQPDILGITSPSVHFNQCRRLCTILKQRINIPIFLGGAHITSIPELLPEEVDVGFIGESEETFVEILRLFNTNSLNKQSLENVKGIVYYDDKGKLKITEKREAIKDLDLIPPPDRTIFPREYLENRSIQILTSRSCPFHCVFCQAAPQHFEYRFHSAEYVVNEISELHDLYGFTEFGINDELFAINKPRIKKIIELLREKGLLGKLKFGVNGRANLINEDLVDLLVQMGVVEVALGLESMSPRILTFLKDAVTVEQNISAVDILYKSGLRVGGLFMIGTPGEAIEDLEITYQYLKTNRSKFGGMTLCITTPLPGTPLWDICIDSGRIESDIIKFDFDKLILSPQECNKNLYVGDIEWDTFIKIHELFMKLFYAPNVPLPRSLLVDMSQVRDNYIIAGINETENVRGNYASENWPGGMIFWSNALVELEAYLRSSGGECKFSIDYKTPFTIFPKAMCEIRMKIIKINTNEILVDEKIEAKPEKWQKNEFKIDPLKADELIKVLIKTDSICLQDLNISDDFRNLGIAIKEMRLK